MMGARRQGQGGELPTGNVRCFCISSYREDLVSRVTTNKGRKIVSFLEEKSDPMEEILRALVYSAIFLSAKASAAAPQPPDDP